MSKALTNINALNDVSNNLSGKVSTTGNETIAGIKTFSSSPVVPASPTTDTQASSKAYTDLARYAVQNTQSGNYTLVLTDNGKHIYCTNAGAQTITIPANATVAFPLGTIVTIINNGTTSVSINSTTNSITTYVAGDGTTGNRTLPIKGMATLIKVDTNTWFITGAGLG